MDYQLLSNNRVSLKGEILSEPTYSHEVCGEEFFETTIAVKRLSGQIDKLPMTVSGKLLSSYPLVVGETVSVEGQLRSYNKIEEEHSKLLLSVFVREIGVDVDDSNPNVIELVGYVCKAPVYRTTPFNREISDVLVAVNRAYNKSDYLPCIAWGRNARFVKNMQVGEKIFIVGRIQSRDYQKQLPNGDIVVRTAYEVSVSRVDTVDADIQETINV